MNLSNLPRLLVALLLVGLIVVIGSRLLAPAIAKAKV